MTAREQSRRDLIVSYYRRGYTNRHIADRILKDGFYAEPEEVHDIVEELCRRTLQEILPSHGVDDGQQESPGSRRG